MLMNNSQMMGLTGKRYRPSWGAFYSEKADALPELKRLGEQKAYQEDMIDVQDKSLGLQKQQLAQQAQYYKDQGDQADRANVINAAAMGLQGAGTLNDLTGGAISKGVGSAAKWLGKGAWDAISSGFTALFG